MRKPRRRPRVNGPGHDRVFISNSSSGCSRENSGKRPAGAVRAAGAAQAGAQEQHRERRPVSGPGSGPARRARHIDRQQFEETVRTLNNLYAEAEKLGGQSYLEGCLACLTAYTIFLCMETHYEKVLKKIAKFIQEQNEKIYAPQGLLLTDPIERGLRVIEITIYEDRGMTSGR
ncbi:PREDICTED: golgin subfamily A member 7 [Chaetura pelagica]|uniref:golgin subfamily A member 7 n=1 Tax=Chaetura pelagica TaxID=8897 RepID=UPI0005237658|nr:PREDICTED: golgin subfamily A member 7 [Chaetura pelagica]